MRKVLFVAAVAAAVGGTALPAGAATGTCFGRDRSAIIDAFFIQTGDTDGWGQLAAERAGNNSTMNREYRSNHC